MPVLIRNLAHRMLLSLELDFLMLRLLDWHGTGFKTVIASTLNGEGKMIYPEMFWLGFCMRLVLLGLIEWGVWRKESPPVSGC